MSTRRVTGKEKRESVNRMRANPTEAEVVMRNALKRAKLGVSVGFQKIICGFIPDFWCAEAKLVIEIDGLIHTKRREYDAERDRIMRDKGITVLRFTNEEVMRDVASCVRAVKAAIGPRRKMAEAKLTKLKREQRADQGSKRLTVKR